jgi:hypothetical protein
MKLFQLIIFGICALLIPVMEKGEGRAVAIIAFCVTFAATWLVVRATDWWRYRS